MPSGPPSSLLLGKSDKMLGDSFLPCVLLSTLCARTTMAQRFPGKAAVMPIRPHDHQSPLIPHDKTLLFLPLLRCRLFCHCHCLSLSACLWPFLIAQCVDQW